MLVTRPARQRGREEALFCCWSTGSTKLPAADSGAGPGPAGSTGVGSIAVLGASQRTDQQHMALAGHLGPGQQQRGNAGLVLQAGQELRLVLFSGMFGRL